MFYYTTANLTSEVNLYVRNTKKAFNLFYTDIETTETAPGEYMVGIRTKDYEGDSEYTYENGDTYETEKPENYKSSTYLLDTSNLAFTIDFGDGSMEEILEEGISAQLK